MIKGCNKRVVIMKDTGSSVFEEAFFILKPGTENTSQSDILVQAQRIIDSKESLSDGFPSGIVYNVDKKKKATTGRNACLFFFGMACGFLTSLLIITVF